MRKLILKTQLSGSIRTQHARPKQPNVGRTWPVRRNVAAAKGMIGGEIMMKKREELDQLVRKIVSLGTLGALATQSKRFQSYSSRCAPDAMRLGRGGSPHPRQC